MSLFFYYTNIITGIYSVNGKNEGREFSPGWQVQGLEQEVPL